MTFAIDGLEDTHAIYRRGSQWHKLIANIKAYSKSNHSNFSINALIFKHNEDQVDKIVALAKSLGAYKINLKYTSRGINPNTPYLKLSRKPTVRKTEGRIACIALERSSLFLSADAIFYPCAYIGYSLYAYNKQTRDSITNLSTEAIQYTPFDPRLPICHQSCTVQENGISTTSNRNYQTILFKKPLWEL